MGKHNHNTREMKSKFAYQLTEYLPHWLDLDGVRDQLHKEGCKYGVDYIVVKNRNNQFAVFTEGKEIQEDLSDVLYDFEKDREMSATNQFVCMQILDKLKNV